MSSDVMAAFSVPKQRCELFKDGGSGSADCLLRPEC